ncbi:MAG: hypothetical protein M3Z03_10920 [Actinomycetota bacterium]|nr:hypothetical protein [Actinomycetota bacterium]
MAVRRTLALAFLVGALAVGIGSLVAYATFPSSEELQRESLERLGLSAEVIDSPFFRAILDQFGSRVEGHVVDHVQRSVLLGIGAGGIVVAIGFALVLVADRRREAAPPTAPSAPPVPPPPTTP